MAGVVSTVLATFAGFGLLVFLGADFTSFNYGAIFIIVGIGRYQVFYIYGLELKSSILIRISDGFDP